MREDALIIISLMAIIWLGWPLHSIAQDFRALRRMAEKDKG